MKNKLYTLKRWHWIRVMVFNGTINNISALSWLSVLLMLKSVAYYRFFFMWYDGIVPILYLDDGSDFYNNVLISSTSFKILDFHSLLLTRRWHCKQSVKNKLYTQERLLYCYQDVQYSFMEECEI
jgi:hypothetical protein